LLDSAEVRLRIRNDSIPFDTAQHPGVNPMGASLGASGALLLGGTPFSGIDTVNALATPPLYDEIQVRLAGNAPGTFLGTPISGPAPFTGTLELRTPGGWFVTVPLVLGGSTSTTVTGFAATGGTPVVAVAQQGPFQTGVVTVGGTGATPLIGTGFNALTPSGEGELVLVSPMRILAPGIFDFQAVAELELRFVPEPGSASLLVWGAAFTALLGRRRQKCQEGRARAHRR
jgi:hypothetical protein